MSSPTTFPANTDAPGTTVLDASSTPAPDAGSEDAMLEPSGPRFYLIAMAHFFSGFSPGEPRGDQRPAS